MLPFQVIQGGSFTSAASAAYHDVVLSCQPDLFMLRNRSDWGDDTAVTAIESEFHRGMAAGSAQTIDQANATGALSSNLVSSNGFTFIDQANPPVFAPLAATAISGIAGTFVVLMANTGSIVVGDWVRLYATTGELQIAGYSFQVTAVSANVSITLGYMASGGQTFVADATAAQVVKFIQTGFYPREMLIANISQAAQAVVHFTGQHDFTPGEIVSFRVSSAFGMDEINNKAVRVLSVVNSGTVSSITLDLDTSAYTAFAFPTSAVAAAGVSPAVCVPSSSGVVPYNGSASVAQQPPGTNLQDAFDNRSRYVMRCGTNVVTAVSTVYDWVAYKYDTFVAE